VNWDAAQRRPPLGSHLLQQPAGDGGDPPLRRFLASAFELYNVGLASVGAAQRHAEHPCFNSCWRLEQGKKEHKHITTELAPMTV